MQWEGARGQGGKWPGGRFECPAQARPCPVVVEAWEVVQGSGQLGPVCAMRAPASGVGAQACAGERLRGYVPPGGWR